MAEFSSTNCHQSQLHVSQVKFSENESFWPTDALTRIEGWGLRVEVGVQVRVRVDYPKFDGYIRGGCMFLVERQKRRKRE